MFFERKRLTLDQVERGSKRFSSLIHGNVFNITGLIVKSALKAEMALEKSLPLILSKHVIHFEVKKKKSKLQHFRIFRGCLPFSIDKLDGI